MQKKCFLSSVVGQARVEVGVKTDGQRIEGVQVERRRGKV